MNRKSNTRTSLFIIAIINPLTVPLACIRSLTSIFAICVILASGINKILSDQSTQVDFPVASRKNHRNIRRYPTSDDIFHKNKNALRSQYSWQNSRAEKQNSLPRPKSLNFPVDPLGSPSKIYSISDSPISRTSVIRETPQTLLSRDKLNVLSYSSSLTSRNGLKSFEAQKFQISPTPIDQESSNCSCKCSCKESAENFTRMDRFSERQCLSWRRLHMSRAKLKASSATSELLSGFAMVAMVELQVNDPTSVPEWLFVIFAVCTTILVSVHIFALMISTYILPNIDAIAKMEICEWVSESPHERMRGFIELAWAFSTVLGLFLFLIEVAILCWVKFWDTSFSAAIAATVIVIPVLIIFVLFAIHFYHSLVILKCNTSLDNIMKLEDMKKQLDNIMVNPV